MRVIKELCQTYDNSKKFWGNRVYYGKEFQKNKNAEENYHLHI